MHSVQKQKDKKNWLRSVFFRRKGHHQNNHSVGKGITRFGTQIRSSKPKTIHIYCFCLFLICRKTNQNIIQRIRRVSKTSDSKKKYSIHWKSSHCVYQCVRTVIVYCVMFRTGVWNALQPLMCLLLWTIRFDEHFNEWTDYEEIIHRMYYIFVLLHLIWIWNVN